MAYRESIKAPYLTEYEAQQQLPALEAAYPTHNFTTDPIIVNSRSGQTLIGYAVFGYTKDAALHFELRDADDIRAETTGEIGAYIKARRLCEKLMETVGL